MVCVSHIDTDLRLAATGAIVVPSSPEQFDPRGYLKEAVKHAIFVAVLALAVIKHLIFKHYQQTMWQRYQSGELTPKVQGANTIDA